MWSVLVTQARLLLETTKPPQALRKSHSLGEAFVGSFTGPAAAHGAKIFQFCFTTTWLPSTISTLGQVARTNLCSSRMNRNINKAGLMWRRTKVNISVARLHFLVLLFHCQSVTFCVWFFTWLSWNVKRRDSMTIHHQAAHYNIIVPPVVL